MKGSIAAKRVRSTAGGQASAGSTGTLATTVSVTVIAAGDRYLRQRQLEQILILLKRANEIAKSDDDVAA